VFEGGKAVSKGNEMGGVKGDGNGVCNEKWLTGKRERWWR